MIWDFEADEDYGRTLIKHGDVVIFSEPARWEESRRFREVAEILKAKYGDRIKDLVPTEGSKLNLYGDDGKSPGFVDNVRAWFVGATPRQEKGRSMDSQRVLSRKHWRSNSKWRQTYQRGSTS